jgi:hypothetical protein
MVLDLELQRMSPTHDDTIGALRDENRIFFCHTMEDEYREVKVPKETRIPAGRYRLRIRKELTGLTKKYLADERLSPWFKFHIEITNVPGFRGVYIHIGNHDDHTDGCILVGLWSDKSKRVITKSVHVYEAFYKKYYPIIDNEDNEVYIDIMNEKIAA